MSGHQFRMNGSVQVLLCALAAVVPGCATGGSGGGGGRRDDGQSDSEGTAEHELELDTPDGPITVALDGRQRPVAIDASFLSATLLWSDDGREVVALVRTESVDHESTVSVDLSDGALRDACQSLEEQTGANFDDFRLFLDENPGLVARAAAGDFSDSAAKQLPRMQTRDPVTRMLVNLRLSFANLLRFAEDWRREQELSPDGVPEPFRSATYDHLRDLAYRLWVDYQQQLEACTACNSRCRADCSRNTVRGACCNEDLTCDDDTPATECPAVFFHEGALCLEVDCTVGCCCVDVDGPVTPQANFDQPPYEVPATADQCAQIQVGFADANLIGITTFFPGASCDVSPCTE